MKKISKSILSLAALATAFTACSEAETEAPGKTPREKVMTVVASSALTTSGTSSRTVLDPQTNVISWSSSGELLRVFETAGTTTTPKTSAEGVVADGKASFAVTFAENTTDQSFSYNAVYPASALSAWSDNDNKDATNVKVATPANQQPTATSFDAAADLLIAFPETFSAQPDQLNLRFARMVAIGKMTIKNLGSTEQVSSIEFRAENKVLAGRSYIDLTAGEVTQYGYTASDNIVLDYAGKEIAANGMTAYFACFPFEMGEGDSFTVIVTTQTKRFTKTVALEGRTLAFTAGDSSTFNVNMEGIEGENTVADLSNATLTFDEIKSAAGSGWGSYGKLYNYEQPGGAIWGIMGYYQNGNTFIQLGATSRESYIRLPEFTKSITAVVVTLNKALTAGKKLLLTTDPAGTTGDIGSVTAEAGQTVYTFTIGDKNVNTAFLRADATSQVTSIEVNAGAAIVAPERIPATANGVADYFTYSTAGFEGEDDTVVSYDGTVVEQAQIDKESKTVSFVFTSNTDFTRGRTGTITLTSAANDIEKIVRIEQLANVLTVPENVAQLGGTIGDTFSFSVTTAFTDLAYDGAGPAFTVALQDDIAAHPDGTYTFVYTVTALNAGAEIETTLGTLTFYQTVAGQRVEPTPAATVPIVQGPAGSTGAVYYVQATAEPADGDWSGTYIIAAGTSACSGLKVGNWITNVAVDIKDNQIESTEASDALAATVERNADGYYSIRFVSGYLRTTNFNSGINFATTASANDAQWSLSIAGNGDVSFANRAYPSRVLRMSGTSGWRTYTSSTGVLPQIYKLTR